MKEQPDGVDPRPVLRSWGIDAPLTYLPVGFGDHHWADEDRRWFVTVADLANKNHNGIGVAAAREGLRRAMDTAVALTDLEFVQAPLRTPSGETLRPLGERYAVSVFPFLDGTSGNFGDPAEPVGDLLDRLHRVPPPAPTPVARPELPGRAGLEEALASLGGPWTGGPFAEPARALLSDHLAGLRRRLTEFDRRLGELRGDLVVTHGEPHPGNIMRIGERRVLVDWDTVGLAVPERDLWWLADAPDTPATRFYRLRWDLDDVSVFVEVFRAPHGRTPDTEHAWSGLAGYVARLAS